MNCLRCKDVELEVQTRGEGTDVVEIDICPQCHGLLNKSHQSILCRRCGALFPICQGVPDFRFADSEFIPSEHEQSILGELLSSYDHASFEDLIDIRYAHSRERPAEIVTQQKKFELTYQQKGNNRLFQIRTLMAKSHMKINMNGWFLDIGCGTGTSIPYIMKDFKHGVGIDYSLIDLIIGKKLLEEKGIDNLRLICADARHLPFREEIFSFANATDVIEHILPGQEQFVSEVKRVLKKGACFYFNSPNRFNLFTPEPHVKLRLLGFLPRALMNRYVLHRGHGRYTSVRLLSLEELRSILRRIFGGSFFVSGPIVDTDAPAVDFKRKMVNRFPFVLWVANRLLLPVMTNHLVLAQK